MASIDFIQKRIIGKQAELEKLNRKLVRIQKAEAGGWEQNNPYYYTASDLKACLNDIESAQTMLIKYQDELKTAEAKASSRNVATIIEFLEGWKANNREFYLGSFERYLKAKAEYRQMEKTYWLNADQGDSASRKQKVEEYETLRKQFHKSWAFLQPYIARRPNKQKCCYDIVLDIDKLNKDLDREADSKYDFIIERTVAIVGEIVDATNLKIGFKGDLNGYIIGKAGKAKVQTFGAGGYNIQCFHFRTTINRA